MVDLSTLPTMSGTLAPPPAMPTFDEMAATRGRMLGAQQQAAATAAQPNAFTSGISSGFHSILGGVGAIGGALGTATGNQYLTNQGNMIVGQQDAAASTRPDLDVAPWAAATPANPKGGGGWGAVMPWLGHQAGEALPTLAAVGGGALVGGAMGGPVGAFIGGAAGAYPSAVGTLYGAAKTAGGGTATPGGALASLVGGVPLAGVQALGPETMGAMRGMGPLKDFMEGVYTKGAIKDIGYKAVAGNAVKGAAIQGGVGAIQSGVTQAATDAIADPDMKMPQRLGNVVDAATTGGVIGGVMGGILGAMPHAAKLEPTATTDDMKGTIDATLKPPTPVDPNQKLLPPPSPTDQMGQPLGITSPLVPGAPRPGEPPLGLSGPSFANRAPDVEEAGGQMRIGGIEEPPHPGLQGTLPPLPDAPAGPPQASIPGLEPPAPAAPVVDRGAQVDALHSQLTDMAPGKVSAGFTRFLATVDGTSQPEAIVALRTYAENTDSSKWPQKLKNLGEALGVTDAQGSERSLPQELVDAQAQKNDLFSQAKKTGDPATYNKALDIQNNTEPKLKSLLALHDAADNVPKEGGGGLLPPPGSAGELAPTHEAGAIPPTTTTPEGTALDIMQNGLIPEPKVEPEAPPQAAVSDTTPDAASTANKPVVMTRAQSMREALKARSDKASDIAAPVDANPGEFDSNLPPLEPTTRSSTVRQSTMSSPTGLGGTEVGDWSKLRSASEPLPVSRPWSPTRPTVDPLQASPPDFNESKQFPGRLNAIINSQTDGGIDAYSAATKQQAIAAQAALTAGNAGPARAMLSDDKFNYRLMASADPDGSALSKNAFDKHFADATKNLPPDSAANFKVVDHPGQLPERVLSDLAERNIDPATVNGASVMRPDGSGTDRYIVRSAAQSKSDVQEAVAHEFIHGQTGDAALHDIFQRGGGVEGLMAIAKKFGADKALNAYMPDNDMTPQDRVDFADEMLAQIGGKAGGSLSTTLRAWAGSLKQAFVGFLKSQGLNSFADKLNTFSSLDAARMIRDMRGVQDGVSPTDLQERVAYSRTPAASDDVLGKMADIGTSFLSKLNARSLSDTYNSLGNSKLALYWNSRTGIIANAARFFGNALDRENPLNKMGEANELRGVVGGFAKDPGIETIMRSDLFLKQVPAARELLTSLMTGTFAKINPEKSWAEHTWLHDRADKAQLEQLVNEKNQVWNQLGQKAGGQQVFHELADIGKLQQVQTHANLLYAVMKRLYGYTGVDPSESYRLDNAAHATLKDGLPFMQNELARLVADGKQLSAEQSARAPVRTDDSGNVIPRVDAYSGIMDSINAAQDRSAQHPYFPTERTGDHFVAFEMKKAADGSTDQNAYNGVRDILNKGGFDWVGMFQGSDTNQFYTRLETLDQRNNMAKLAEKMRDAGHLEPHVGEDGKTSYNISRGLRTDPGLIEQMAPSWMQSLVRDIKDDPTFEKYPELATALQDQYLNLLPENAMLRTWQPRKGVQGFLGDPLKALTDHNNRYGESLGGMVTSERVRDAMSTMAAKVQAARSDGNPNLSSMENVFNELALRQAATPWKQQSPLINAINRAAHVSYLGFSPGYMVEQLSQLGTLLIPSLAKQYKYRESVVSTVRAMGQAMPIMKAIMTGPRGLEGYINEDGLRKAGVAEPQIKTLMEAVNDGRLSFASFTQAAGAPRGGLEDGVHHVERMANATAMGGELYSRLVAVLAADDLYRTGGNKNNTMSLRDFRNHTVDESMMTWDSANSPRATSSTKGFAGPLSPIMGKFMNFQVQMIQTLYKHFGQAFTHENFIGEGATPDQIAQAKDQSRKFLLGHLAASTAFAGTMGLPAAGWLAGAASKITGFLPGSINPSGQAFDFTLEYRNYLASMFGPQAAEVIVHGLPRLAGIDMSDIGDGNLAPFTRLMEDRRKLEDSSKAYALQSFGAPASMMLNWAMGTRDLVNGNVMEGMRKMAPSGAKNLIEAYRMSTQGYLDPQGNKMAITPEAHDILAQMFGLPPSNKEEAAEQSRSAIGSQEDETYKSGVLKQAYVRASQNGGDTTAAMDAINAHDEALPENAIAPTLGSYLKGVQEAPIKEQATGVPKGVKLGSALADKLQSFNIKYPQAYAQ